MLTGSRLVALLLSLVTCASALEGYRAETIGAWTAQVIASAPVETDDWRRFHAALVIQVQRVEAAFPAARLAELRAVPLVVDAGDYRAFGCQFHPSEGWLVEHGYPRTLAKTVEICNWREFITLVDGQPWVLLHELSHAYQDRHPEIDAPLEEAYQHARGAGLYQQVTRNHGVATMPAYALTNAKEYFAELSEAYFGENDFAPYDRKELKEYDPLGFQTIERIWLGR